MAQVLLSAPPVQAYFLSPEQLTKKGLFGGAMRDVLEASRGAPPDRSTDLIALQVTTAGWQVASISGLQL